MIASPGLAVAELNAVFLTDWYSETDEILTDTMGGFRGGSATGDVTVEAYNYAFGVYAYADEDVYVVLTGNMDITSEDGDAVAPCRRKHGWTIA